MIIVRVLIGVAFVVVLAIAAFDFWLAKFSPTRSAPSIQLTLQTKPGTPLSQGRPAQVDVSTTVDPAGTLLCVAAVFEFPDVDAAGMDPNAPGVIPTVTITGAPVLLYGDAPFTTTPDDFSPGFIFRPQIDLDKVDWTPFPPGFPDKAVALTLPTFNTYRPAAGTPYDPAALAFSYSSGCFVVDASPTKSDGLASSTYTLVWGNQATQPVLSSKTADTVVRWQFDDTDDPTRLSVRPTTTETKDGSPAREFSFNDVSQSEVTVGSPGLVSLVGVAYWAAAALGALILAELFRVLVKRARKDNES